MLERDRWVEAMEVERLYAERAPQHIAERITVLSKAGDMDGVQRWRDIAARYDELQRARNMQ